MPLDQAIYHPGRNSIFATWGGTIYEIDPNTATKLNSNRFELSGMSPSNLCYNDDLDEIYAVCWNNPHIWHINSWPQLMRWINKVTPSTLSSSRYIDAFVTIGGFDVTYVDPSIGIHSMAYKNDRIYVSMTHNGMDMAAYSISASNPSSSNVIEWDVGWGAGASQIVHDNYNYTGSEVRHSYYQPSGSRDVIWISDQGNGWIYGAEMSPVPYGGGLVQTNIISNWVPQGLAIDTSGNTASLWASSCDRRIIRFNISNPDFENEVLFPDITAIIDTGRPNFQGYRIRHDEYSGKIYAAGYADNSICVIDPLDNSYVVKTGYELPFDFVFTPTKQWVIQHGRAGLTEYIPCSNISPAYNITTTNTTSSVLVEWELSGSELPYGYVVERSSSASPYYTSIATVANPYSTSYNDDTIIFGDPYFYRVYSYSSCMFSHFADTSSIQPFPPFVPAAVNARQSGSLDYTSLYFTNSISIVSASGEPDIGYTLFKASGSSEFEEIMTLSPSTFRYEDTNSLIYYLEDTSSIYLYWTHYYYKVYPSGSITSSNVSQVNTSQQSNIPTVRVSQNMIDWVNILFMGYPTWDGVLNFIGEGYYAATGPDGLDPAYFSLLYTGGNPIGAWIFNVGNHLYTGSYFSFSPIVIGSNSPIANYASSSNNSASLPSMMYVSRNTP